jgi:hypothetical protein
MRTVLMTLANALEEQSLQIAIFYDRENHGPQHYPRKGHGPSPLSKVRGDGRNGAWLLNGAGRLLGQPAEGLLEWNRLAGPAIASIGGKIQKSGALVRQSDIILIGKPEPVESNQ